MSRFSYYVYIITNKLRTVFYIGITNNLDRRIYEHKHDSIEGFSKQYKLHNLVYFEEYPSVTDAITREKQLKGWHREWKINLIKTINPSLKDLTIE
ncbi:MAG: excinuclease ABC subunit C [Candidatus Gottesmanbacteria bacterium GW2011_GWA1_34_13]|uniref:Excinuclease ABC subunit C n=1 Tax=Candidatus Gottesmanbacteria bacterium GW2011_GWA1_34_13 TaxID=1618434 RepID=A0A0G0APK9_9BACT|nr:MAG: excinuclease ABC subunit C [Candidatus Gottesmanbacteria bacterium GW2011_GWA1_34_13]